MGLITANSTGRIFKYAVPHPASMTRYTVLIEKDEQGWLVSEVVELPGCHTQAKSMDELLVRTREAIQAYLASGEVPAVLPRFVGMQHIEV